MTKVCRKCGKEKAGEDFYSGWTCKECIKAYQRKRREEKLDEVREYDRKRSNLPHRVRARKEYQKTEAGRIAGAKAKRKWQEQNPERKAAHTILGNRLRSGEITKPDRCGECGKKTRIHGHHDDYSKPLDVKWVCGKCHKNIHANINQRRTQ